MAAIVGREDLLATKIADSHLVVHHGRVGLGVHLLVDLYEVANRRMLTDGVFIEKCLREAATVSGATVEVAALKPFPGGGIAGVLVLSESHISIHTWPELGAAALDIFMCGSTDPFKGLRVIHRACEGILVYEPRLRGEKIARYL